MTEDSLGTSFILDIPIHSQITRSRLYVYPASFAVAVRPYCNFKGQIFVEVD